MGKKILHELDLDKIATPVQSEPTVVKKAPAKRKSKAQIEEPETPAEPAKVTKKPRTEKQIAAAEARKEATAEKKRLAQLAVDEANKEKDILMKAQEIAARQAEEEKAAKKEAAAQKRREAAAAKKAAEPQLPVVSPEKPAPKPKKEKVSKPLVVHDVIRQVVRKPHDPVESASAEIETEGPKIGTRKLSHNDKYVLEQRERKRPIIRGSNLPQIKQRFR